MNSVAIVKNGKCEIFIDSSFKKENKNITEKNVLDLMKLFDVENGVRADLDVFNIDLFDELKCYYYDENNNPVINLGSFVDHKIIFNTIKFYLNQKDSNVRSVYFDIKDQELAGAIYISDNHLHLYDLGPEEVNVKKTKIPNVLYSYGEL